MLGGVKMLTSKEMFEMFEEMSTKELQILISMAIQYLNQNKGVEFKQIIKDIKNVHKLMNN